MKDKEIISFKESLTIQADEECKNISSEISCIKDEMQEFLLKREYTIQLIEPKISSLAFGGYSNISNIFIPKGINPNDYRRIFIKELKDLGFTDEDMSLSEDISNDYNIYKILVRW